MPFHPRTERTLAKLRRHDISSWALASGLAIETQIARHGGTTIARPAHDIDFVVAGFHAIPPAWARSFWSAKFTPPIRPASYCCNVWAPTPPSASMSSTPTATFSTAPATA